MTTNSAKITTNSNAPKRGYNYTSPQGLLARVLTDADGKPFPDKDGAHQHGYKALDTGEIVWVGTFKEVSDWAGTRTGVEPFDRHLAYWERRYAARRYARRVGNLPSYPDLYEAAADVIDALEAGIDANEIYRLHLKLQQVLGERERV